MILTINAVSTDTATISLDEKILDFKPLNLDGNQQVLVKIDQLFNDNQISPKSITKIVVNPGPGSFTSVRVAIAIANALAQSWAIPVSLMSVPEKDLKLAEPFYDRPATITQKK